VLACRYPEGGKRGIPAIYMSSLEKRLQETELALYVALSTLEGKEGIDSAAEPQLQQSANPAWRQLSKLEKQKEWTRLPLNSKEQLAVWFREKKRAGHHTETQDERLLNSELTSFTSPDERGTGVCGHTSRAGKKIPRQSEQTPLAVSRQQQIDSRTTSEQLREFQVPGVPNNARNELSGPWQNYF
jgi:hypothetical protein